MSALKRLPVIPNRERRKVNKALANLDSRLQGCASEEALCFDNFLEFMAREPHTALRNVFQLFHDMVKTYVEAEREQDQKDPEALAPVQYNCRRLTETDTDHPFFADRLFANRFVAHVEALRHGSQQNKIYIFHGPAGSGKSTFLNNLLQRFETYSQTEAGTRYEAVWRLDPQVLNHRGSDSTARLYARICRLMEGADARQASDARPDSKSALSPVTDNGPPGKDKPEILEIPCPSHDHPILLIPRDHRRNFFDDLLCNDEFKWKLFTEKEYDWVFKQKACTICTSIYQALLGHLGDPRAVFAMLHARPYRFRRRLGEGISVFNPGDRPVKQNVLTNAMLQRRINRMLQDSNQVKYLYSRYAKTNHGVYALMDIKAHNIERLIELHNIISDGVHKVEDIEENVHSLLLALMNPEDRKNIHGLQSFSDRIEYIPIPYVLDIETEVNIYRNVFGRHIEELFLPKILVNFARVIVATRLVEHSAAMQEWIADPQRYEGYCDRRLHLLKMEIYAGRLPAWLAEEDRKRFTAKRRRDILAEAELDGRQGLSGREALKIFNAFYSRFARPGKLIDMADLHLFFTRIRTDLQRSIPDGLLDALVLMYDYLLLQEIKEALYYYNEEQIQKDLGNYLFAVNFETGTTVSCAYTGEKLEIDEDFLGEIEGRLLGPGADRNQRQTLRREIQREYSTYTLPQEIVLQARDYTQTKLFRSLHARYVFNLKEKVLDPFLQNENFRQAIKDYPHEAFKTHDRRIRADVSYLMENLIRRNGYSEQGAREVCMYLIDKGLPQRFAEQKPQPRAGLSP